MKFITVAIFIMPRRTLMTIQDFFTLSIVQTKVAPKAFQQLQVPTDTLQGYFPWMAKNISQGLPMVSIKPTEAAQVINHPKLVRLESQRAQHKKDTGPAQREAPSRAQPRARACELVRIWPPSSSSHSQATPRSQVLYK